MKDVLTVMAMTLRLAVRSRTLFAVMIVVAAVAAFIFGASRGDGEVVNELQLRVQYSYAFAYSVLTLLLIAIACYTVRSQIDGKQMHMLTSLPIGRAHIWLGQWLALIVLAAIGLGTLFVTIGGCCWLLMRQAPAAEAAAAREQLGRIRYEVWPQRPPLRQLVKSRLAELRAAGTLPDKLGDAAREQIARDARKADQLVPARVSRTWQFALPGDPQAASDTLEIRFRFYADKRRDPVVGTWTLSSVDGKALASVPFSAYPFTSTSVTVPVSHLAGERRFALTLDDAHTRDLIVTRASGLRVFYDDGPLAANIVKAFGLQLVHLAAISAAGLMMGVAFTFAVSAFLTLVLFALSLSSGFFVGMVRESGDFLQQSVQEQLGVGAMQLGLWLTRGLQPPDIVSDFSTGTSIPLGWLASSWLPGLLVYLVIVAGLGSILLQRKELDKVQTGRNTA
jgi:ABC-type transport system involved in multi-copper enzyme maturation permease subunit